MRKGQFIVMRYGPISRQKVPMSLFLGSHNCEEWWLTCLSLSSQHMLSLGGHLYKEEFFQGLRARKAAGIRSYIPSQCAANFAGLLASGGLSLNTSHTVCSNSSSFQCTKHRFLVPREKSEARYFRPTQSRVQVINTAHVKCNSVIVYNL